MWEANPINDQIPISNRTIIVKPMHCTSHMAGNVNNGKWLLGNRSAAWQQKSLMILAHVACVQLLGVDRVFTM